MVAVLQTCSAEMETLDNLSLVTARSLRNDCNAVRLPKLEGQLNAPMRLAVFSMLCENDKRRARTSTTA